MSTQPESIRVQVVDARKPQELFALNSTYLISPGATSDELLDDAGCFLDAVSATVNTLASGLINAGSDINANPQTAGSMLWGVLHQLEMVNNMIAAAQVRAVRS